MNAQGIAFASVTHSHTMVTVADALNKDFTRSWHEAVAIVLEVASHLSPGQGVPRPDDILLGPDGVLSFGFANEAAGNPVGDLASLLLTLLDGTPAPAPLRDLAVENATPDSKHTTVEGFAKALSFYERPGRASDMAAVAGRLGSFRPRAPEEEFDRLRQKLAEAPAAASKSQKRSWTRRQMVIAGGAACLLASIGVLTITRIPGGTESSSAGIGGTVARAEEKLTKTMTGALGLLRGTKGEAPAADAGRTPEAEQAEAATASKVKRPASAVAQARSRPLRANAKPDAAAQGTTGALDPAAGPVGAQGQAFIAVSVAESGGPLIEVDPERVYSSADAAVRPPVLLRPQLPSRPLPNAETGYFDIIVNEQGTASVVTLISPVNHFYDSMLVAAAKAWRFRPAVRDGRAVKYRIRIPITGSVSLR